MKILFLIVIISGYLYAVDIDYNDHEVVVFPTGANAGELKFVVKFTGDIRVDTFFKEYSVDYNIEKGEHLQLFNKPMTIRILSVENGIVSVEFNGNLASEYIDTKAIDVSMAKNDKKPASSAFGFQLKLAKH